jgi:predicted porin
MIKKLLPTMIGAALVGGMTTAAADVTVFGHLDTSIDMVDVEEPGFSIDDTNLHCTTCSIGFKGSEDLGNGLKAIFKLDFQFNMTERGGESSSGNSEDTIRDEYGSPTSYSTSLFEELAPRFGSENDTDAITDRDQWLGLAGGFGQIRIGTISTVYKSHGAMLDPLYRTSLQAREHGLMSNYFHSGAGEEANGRATNTFRYDSPNFSGFKVGAHYTLDNNEGDGEDDNPFGIGGSYENGGILVFADYITNDGGNANPNGDISAWKIGGKFSMDAFAVMAQYEDAEEDNFSEELQQWHIGGTFTMGNNLIYAAYGQNEVEFDGVKDHDVDAWTIALMHSLSKRTKAYVGYNTREESESDVEIDQFSVGMKHKF